MSGPIVRKYGFPNHDRIFGKKEIEHGVDDSTPAAHAEPDASADAAPEPKASKAKPKKASKGK